MTDVVRGPAWTLTLFADGTGTSVDSLDFTLRRSKQPWSS